MSLVDYNKLPYLPPKYTRIVRLLLTNDRYFGNLLLAIQNCKFSVMVVIPTALHPFAKFVKVKVFYKFFFQVKRV